MKYSLRSLMIVVALGPPVLAGLYLWITQTRMWELAAFMATWLFFFGLIVAYSSWASPRKLAIGGRCSFCNRPYPETGAMAEGPSGVLICYPCASGCKDLIEQEYRNRGIELGNHDSEPTAHPP